MKYKCQDHLGQEFTSMVEMARHWNISNKLLSGRLSKGWTLEDALTKKNQGRPESNTWTDHEGNVFPSLAQMAKHWNISWSCLKHRLDLGMNIKAALTAPTDIHPTQKRFACTDHKGNQFSSQKEMLEYWNITQSNYNIRRRKGWDMARALETPSKRHNSPCKDHTGASFPSRAAMLAAWDVNPIDFKNRTKMGWTLEQILTTPVRDAQIEIVDHTGKTWPSRKALCSHYNIEPSTFQNRINHGWTMKVALETPSLRDWYSPGIRIGDTIVLGSIFDETIGLYYACKSANDFEDLYSHQELCEMQKG